MSLNVYYLTRDGHRCGHAQGANLEGAIEDAREKGLEGCFTFQTTKPTDPSVAVVYVDVWV